MNFKILHGDTSLILKELPDSIVDCIVTSPPYWGLRDYGMAGQIGTEETLDLYLGKMSEIFREARRVLKKTGTFFLNMGDCYVGASRDNADGPMGKQWKGVNYHVTGLKSKDLIGLPWRLAFALQADGWWLRSDIVWHKPNPMPESVRDRPTRSHEFIFLLTKAKKYFYDADAIKEPGISASIIPWEERKAAGEMSRHGGSYNAPSLNHKKMPSGWAKSGNHSAMDWNRGERKEKQRGHSRRHNGFNERWDHMTRQEQCGVMRNKRSVWTVPTRAFHGAHFATFPEKLIEPCILAGCPPGGLVLDPFCGSGTTGVVSLRNNRNFLGIELNESYIKMARKRIYEDAPMFNFEEAV